MPLVPRRILGIPCCLTLRSFLLLLLCSWTVAVTAMSSSSVTRIFGTSPLARQIPFTDAWKPSSHARFCCLIYATQNGWKLPILFEELGEPYDWALIDFETNQQKSKDFLQINPNGRIPALIDRQEQIAVAESGSILEYVCDTVTSPTARTLWPRKTDDLATHLLYKQWIYWQVSAQGPMMGQSMYFHRIAVPQGHTDDFAMQRFQTEAKRCLTMLNEQLATSGGPFLFGPHVSIVDVATFPYAASAYWACVDVTDLPLLQAWLTLLHQRPSFQTGLTIPFARPAFFGPPWATKEQIQAEITANAAQFQIKK